MPELPGGTVTFLFTDVEASTKLLDELGDEYADALEGHRQILREAFTAHDGTEVDTQGDAFFIAFARASDAAAAAIAAQRALEHSPLRVRMGLHTGEPLIRERSYVGMDVHRAARVMSAGHGGQVVVSERTRSLLPDDLPLSDLGMHRLKDLRGAERLYQLGPGNFPPLRSLDATNLPVAATELLGRQRELADVVGLLSNGSRLVTITGPGGTGKTRLALQACAELVGQMKDGVYWVPLAGVTEPDLVLPEAAQAVGAKEDLPGHMRDRELLLLLDNFEHVLDAAPALADLLAGAPNSRILVTSRARLQISGEREYALEPLAPEASATLFCERARSVGRDVDPDETVDAICRRLDGLPLAIELAAARVKVLAPTSLLDRLEHALPLLTGGVRDAPARQQTLRSTIEWSYDLLDAEAQGLFARLAVFAAGFSLEAAETVTAASLDALGSLIDVSLLKAVGGERFLMLETIREYAGEQLADGGDSERIRRRHADYFAALAQEAYGGRLEDEAAWSSRLETDHDDLRLALDWLGENDPAAELELAGALGWFWLAHSHLQEGARRLDDALEHGLGTPRGIARALTAAGGIAAQTGRPDDMSACLERAFRLWRELSEPLELAGALEIAGWAHFFSGDNERSLASFEESLELRRALPGGTAPALAGVCQVLVAEGEVDRAEPLAQELLDEARRSRDIRSEHFGLHFLADCALMRGEYEAAESGYRESLQAARLLGDVVETSLEVQGVAMAAAGRGDLARAARLGGAVEGLWESIGLAVEVPFWTTLLDGHLGSLRRDVAWREGRALSFDEAVELALAPC